MSVDRTIVNKVKQKLDTWPQYGEGIALDPCLIYFRQTKEWRQAAEPA